MYLKNLHLRNFRNFSEEVIPFSTGINVIYGDNAQGKSSILEAIYLFSVGRSFRSTKLQELIKHGESFYFLEALFSDQKQQNKVTCAFDGKEKLFTAQGHKKSSFFELLGFFPLVLHSPEDKSLITGTPQLRRRALNILASQMDPLYAYHLTRYAKALKQRNALLKQKKHYGIDPFEEEMAHSGMYITNRRITLCHKITPLLEGNYSLIASSQEKASLSYHACYETDSYITEAELLALLEKNRSKDFDYGHTLFGPHRDDFTLSLDKLSGKKYASEGQKSTLACAFRLSQYDLMLQEGKKAFFAIDDFGSQLDPKREERLLTHLAAFDQVFLTTPEEKSFTDITVNPLKIEKGHLSHTIKYI
jgi:DNA replication and repair protein RecF